jgi:riboflavin biosynthesis pyrimidine reductase
MRLLFSLLSALSLIYLSLTVAAQNKNPTYQGVANGVVRDSVYNYVLQSATIAIYKAKDSSLVTYQLANNFGEFNFKELPVDVPLRITVSFTGYKTHSRVFIVLAKTKKVEFKNINLDRIDNNLAEVIVKAMPPPVSMKGDTIEFNADAFVLDKNAVAEDLLRRLPGITIWGDGTITFNGKEIRRVMVEGKPFFGNDPRIATQNIAKNAIDKIQVYREPKSIGNSLDSLTDINIKLKKNKQYGHFGKLGAGYGTDHHYEGDANLNYFNSSTQLGVVGAVNDINKIAKDASSLMRKSTFKGTGANIEYQPDFSLPGVNRPRSGGLVFQHDFIPVSDFYNNNRLIANFFITNVNKRVDQAIQTTTRLSGDSTQTQQNKSQYLSNYTDQSLDVRYDKKKDRLSFYANMSANSNQGNDQSTTQSSSSDTHGLQSTNDSYITNDNVRKKIKFETGFGRQGSVSGVSNPLTDFKIEYAINANADDNKKKDATQFVSLISPGQDRHFDRTYDSKYKYTKQHFGASLDNLFSGWIPYDSWLNRVALKIDNSLDLNLRHEVNNVKDRDIPSGNYLLNPYLTNDMHTNEVDERVALIVSKSYQKALFGRYIKSLDLQFDAGMQFFNQNNNSDQFFQNFTKSYKKFIPKAGVVYRNNQFGEFEDFYYLNLTSSVEYPTVQQLYPLIDSSYQYYIHEGNPKLKPSSSRILSFNFRHTNLKTKNTFNYALTITGIITINAFSDSVITDNAGRNIHYVVNAEDSKRLSINGSLNKAFKYTNHQLQLNINTDVSLSRMPGYVNNIFIASENFSTDNKVSLYYTFKDKLAFNFMQGYNYYRSQQTGNGNNKFTNTTLPTSASVSASCTKRLSLNSDINYNHSSSTNVTPIDFTIWNISATYRLLAGNNLELKLAALDLLHQNTNIISYGNNNVIVYGRTNVLRQYGMISVSYYPRQFGKKKK